MDHVEWDFGVKTYLLHNGIEQDLLNKIQVFGHHEHHIDFPALHKTLNGRLYLFIGDGVKAIAIRKGLLHKVQQILLVVFLFLG